ncbi:PREDICTED: uncharacterized protein LOC108610929 [Drosophila arizonae]|uniref:Uncharacterized protein LOC108610929 n=1 Tax=Drosophila arizonae TaxID=7263 RepID=A0ABM1NV14_DROAR|nr:PREDICTED: uncharacterized protein LOC108610929 [Drosophila arizonae]
MSDAAPTRAARVAITLMLLSLLGSTASEKATSAEDTSWMAPLQQQYGWDASELRNKMHQGDATTYELGTPNYQILNPEDEPEYITADQPHYQEMLRRLTSSSNGSHTIDMTMPSTISSASAVASASGSASASDEPKEVKWEKLQKRSFNQPAVDSGHEEPVEAVPLDERSHRPRIQVYAGAKPFQTLIANLS